MKNYVKPRTMVIKNVTVVVLSHSCWAGGDCPECNDEWPVMPPDPEEDCFSFSRFN